MKQQRENEINEREERQRERGRENLVTAAATNIMANRLM